MSRGRIANRLPLANATPGCQRKLLRATFAARQGTHSIDRLPNEHLWQHILARPPAELLYAIATIRV
jgi:hypothetical protein